MKKRVDFDVFGKFDKSYLVKNARRGRKTHLVIDEIESKMAGLMLYWDNHLTKTYFREFVSLLPRKLFETKKQKLKRDEKVIEYLKWGLQRITSSLEDWQDAKPDYHNYVKFMKGLKK